jgi:hypothetical protein
VVKPSVDRIKEYVVIDCDHHVSDPRSDHCGEDEVAVARLIFIGRLLTCFIGLRL